VPQILRAGTNELEIGDQINGRTLQILPTVQKEGTLKQKAYPGSWLPTGFSGNSVYIEELKLDRPYPYAIFRGSGDYRMSFSWVGTPSHIFRP
jgi:hypothetical protein